MLWKGRSPAVGFWGSPGRAPGGDQPSFELSITEDWWRWFSFPHFYERAGRNTVCSFEFVGEELSYHLCQPKVSWKGFNSLPPLMPSRSALYSILQSWQDITAVFLLHIRVWLYYIYNGCNLYVCVCRWVASIDIWKKKPNAHGCCHEHLSRN